MKFLKTRKTESLRWERFRREVDYLSSLGERPGVLPILDHDLPEAPRAGERAWYSMPEATALAAALADADLSEVVAALVPIAATLADLAERDGARPPRSEARQSLSLGGRTRGRRLRPPLAS